MAENQEYEDMANGEFAQDSGEQNFEQQQEEQMNGEGVEGEGNEDGNEAGGQVAPTDSGSAEAPGRDDDRFIGSRLNSYLSSKDGDAIR